MGLARLVERLTELSTRVASARRARVAAHILLAVALMFLLLRIRSIWRDSSVDVSRISWPTMTAALALAAAGLLASAFVWLAILHRLGATVRASWAGIFLQSQLAKYVPGTIWQYAGRIALAQGRGLGARLVTVSLGIELGGLACSACIASILLVGWWATSALVVVAAVSVILVHRRSGALARPPAAATVQAMGLFVLSWPLWGLSFWLTARALVPVPASDIPIYVGAFAAAWVVGLVAVYAPGGLGVREAMLVAILHGRLGASDAVVVAAASRAVLTLIDLGGAAVGVMLLRREKPSLAVESGGTA